MNWSSLLAGAVGLAVLDGLVSRPAANANVGGWISHAGSAVRWFLSPEVPGLTGGGKAKSLPPNAFGGAPAPAQPTVKTPTGPPALSPQGTVTGPSIST